MSKDKVISRELAAKVAMEARAQERIVVFTSGVFDLLHSGHVRYLEEARSKGDLLIVGVNSDKSVRENKGELRPIVGEIERADVVAGLGCVDHVFIFSEKNNRENIELLKPAVYAKAGDYSKSTLSSATLVESYGGKIELLAFKDGVSSSSIIDKIAALYSSRVVAATELPRGEPRPAVFLDRDGTINEFVDYLSSPDQFQLIPGVLDALSALQGAGYRLIVTTNQPGIGLGVVSREDFFGVTRKFFGMLGPAGIKVDKIYFCPHSEAESCSCRKPKTGMIDRACAELAIDKERSFVVGDTTMDIQFATNAGIRSILVKTGIAGGDKRFAAPPTHVSKDLKAAADYIISQKAG